MTARWKRWCSGSNLYKHSSFAISKMSASWLYHGWHSIQSTSQYFVRQQKWPDDDVISSGEAPASAPEPPHVSSTSCSISNCVFSNELEHQVKIFSDHYKSSWLRILTLIQTGFIHDWTLSMWSCTLNLVCLWLEITGLIFLISPVIRRGFSQMSWWLSCIWPFCVLHYFPLISAFVIWFCVLLNCFANNVRNLKRAEVWAWPKKTKKKTCADQTKLTGEERLSDWTGWMHIHAWSDITDAQQHHML